jgi:thiol:disulfide interchange protein
MVTLQRWLSVPMFLTAAALAWLLWRQTGQTGLMIGLALLATLAGLLAYARRKQPTGLRFGVMLAGLALLTFSGFPFIPRDEMVVRLSVGSVPFSEAELQRLQAEKTPVFLYFTADWCLSCKVNERLAISREEVQMSFLKKGVRVMVGDWTNGDAAISRFLEAKGRSGVPLYLYYPADGSPPRLRL